MKRPKPWLALMLVLAASLSACSIARAHHVVAAVTAPDRQRCPQGRLLPPGTGIAIDYVDFLRYGGRDYVAMPGRMSAADLGPVVMRVRCSLAAQNDGRHTAPRQIDSTASFLSPGSAVYQVRGYLPGCRLAAYLGGRPQAYLAQITVDNHSAPAPCALHRM